MTLYSIVLDLLLAVLLVIAILYCWRLDMKLKALRTGERTMVEAARELQTALGQAQAAISQLRESADDAGRDLQGRIETARALAQVSEAQAAAPRFAGREEGGVALRRRTSG